LRIKFSTLTAQVAEFLWPGDEPNKIVSTLSYPNQIQPAIDSAKALANYFALLPHSRPMVVNFVGHSLGCRVVVELLSRWAHGGLPPNTSVGVVVLMAAAVVVRNVDANGALRSGATLSAKNPVLCSEGDPVLQWAFPMGETAAGEAFFPTAVGRAGGPANTWHVPLPMAHNGVLYVHGSYWPGDESCTAVAFALGGTPARSTPENAVAANPAPVENSIEFRSTPVRTLGSRAAFA
jgi:pimeloyl-ACP methyl ester carboxylesterase